MTPSNPPGVMSVAGPLQIKHSIIANSQSSLYGWGELLSMGHSLSQPSGEVVAHLLSLEMVERRQLAALGIQHNVIAGYRQEDFAQVVARNAWPAPASIWRLARTSHTGHGLRRVLAVRAARRRPKSVATLRSRRSTPRAGRPGATRRAALSRRRGASRRLPDAMHRAARRSCPVGATAPRRPWPV